MNTKYILTLSLALFRLNLFGHDQNVHQEITKKAEGAAYAYSSSYDDLINAVSSDRLRLEDLSFRGLLEGNHGQFQKKLSRSDTGN